MRGSVPAHRIKPLLVLSFVSLAAFLPIGLSSPEPFEVRAPVWIDIAYQGYAGGVCYAVASYTVPAGGTLHVESVFVDGGIWVAQAIPYGGTYLAPPPPSRIWVGAHAFVENSGGALTFPTPVIVAAGEQLSVGANGNYPYCLPTQAHFIGYTTPS